MCVRVCRGVCMPCACVLYMCVGGVHAVCVWGGVHACGVCRGVCTVWVCCVCMCVCARRCVCAGGVHACGVCACV